MCSQSWQLQPSVQKEVDAALAVLDSYAKPTIAFHGERGVDTFHSGAYTLMHTPS